MIYFSVCEYKTYSKRESYMLTLGIEPMYFVSEEYCHHVLKRLATSGCGKQPPFRNIHRWKQSKRDTRLGKLMIFNSRLTLN